LKRRAQISDSGFGSTLSVSTVKGFMSRIFAANVAQGKSDRWDFKPLVTKPGEAGTETHIYFDLFRLTVGKQSRLA